MSVPLQYLLLCLDESKVERDIYCFQEEITWITKFETYGLWNLFFYLEWEDWVPGSKEAYMDYNVLFLL